VRGWRVVLDFAKVSLRRRVVSDAKTSHSMQRGLVGGDAVVEAPRTTEATSALDWLFGDGVRPLALEAAVFDAALEGWWRQQAARHLKDDTRRDRIRVVRRFRDAFGVWPWEWRAVHVDEWLEDLGGSAATVVGLDAARLPVGAAGVSRLSD
jgi:hypothetical protein